MFRGQKQFRSPIWLKLFLSFFAVLIPVVAVFEYRAQKTSWVFAGLLLLAVIMPLGVIAVFTDQIDLEENEIRIRHNFRRSRVSRADIDKVAWAKGVGAILTLKDGSTVKLPDIGVNSQGMSNSIRAWVKAA